MLRHRTPNTKIDVSPFRLGDGEIKLNLFSTHYNQADQGMMAKMAMSAKV